MDSEEDRLKPDIARLVRLIAIIDEHALRGRDPLDAALAAAEGGATAVQLRFKTLSSGRFLDLAQRCVMSIPVPLFVNDRTDIALLAGAAGVHVGSDDLSPSDVRRLTSIHGGELLVGASVGTDEEVDAALREPVDYWGVGPFNVTPSKSEAGAPLGSDGLARVRRRAPEGIAIVAIGGIDEGNCSLALRSGADGVSVIGALLAGDSLKSIVERTARLRRAVDAALA